MTAPMVSASNGRFFLPLNSFETPDLKSLEKRVIGRYSDRRCSFVRGHKHAGIDIQGRYGEPIYPIGKGRVINIFRDFPNQTIYIKHVGPKHTVFYSVYIHVADVRVEIGDAVSENTVIARMFNQKELALSDFGTSPHLHLEIRHSVKDNGQATFSCMTLEELSQYCIDPMVFFQKRTITERVDDLYQ